MEIRDYQLLALKIKLIDCYQMVERFEACGLIYESK
jgi:hypothetical protein